MTGKLGEFDGGDERLTGRVTTANFPQVWSYILGEIEAGNWNFADWPLDNLQEIPLTPDPEGRAVEDLNQWINRHLKMETQDKMFDSIEADGPVAEQKKADAPEKPAAVKKTAEKPKSPAKAAKKTKKSKRATTARKTTVKAKAQPAPKPAADKAKATAAAKSPTQAKKTAKEPEKPTKPLPVWNV